MQVVSVTAVVVVQIAFTKVVLRPGSTDSSSLEKWKDVMKKENKSMVSWYVCGNPFLTVDNSPAPSTNGCSQWNATLTNSVALHSGRKGIAYVLDACPPSIWGNSLPEYAEQLLRGWSLGRLLSFDIAWHLLDMSHKHGIVQYAARQGASSTLGLFTVRWLVNLVWKPDGMFVVSRMTRARLCGRLLSLWRASGISCITMISCKSQLATGAAWQSCRSDNV